MFEIEDDGSATDVGAHFDDDYSGITVVEQFADVEENPVAIVEVENSVAVVEVGDDELVGAPLVSRLLQVNKLFSGRCLPLFLAPDSLKRCRFQLRRA